jgi:hexulose-6-phosphate isomerase
MKKSLNAWAVDAQIGFEETFKIVKESGFDGIELNVDKAGSSAHCLTLDTSIDELKIIKKLLEKYSLPVVSVSTSLSCVGAADPSMAEFAKDVIRAQLKYARFFEAAGILTVPGGITDGVSIKQAYENSFACLESLKEEVYQSGLYAALEEVWNGFFTSPVDMASFIDRLDCPQICAYFDVGNVTAFSWAECWIEILASRIKLVHIKDFKRNGGINRGGAFVNLLEGDVNWKKVIPALKKAGFDGYLTAEVFIDDLNDPGLGYEDFYRRVSAAEDTIINL